MDRELIIRMEILSEAIKPEEDSNSTELSIAYRKGFSEAVEIIKKMLETELEEEAS